MHVEDIGRRKSRMKRECAPLGLKFLEASNIVFRYDPLGAEFAILDKVNGKLVVPVRSGHDGLNLLESYIIAISREKLDARAKELSARIDRLEAQETTPGTG